MLYWDADELAGGEVEQLYARWEHLRPEWRDQVELGERVAAAFASGNLQQPSQPCTPQVPAA